MAAKPSLWSVSENRTLMQMIHATTFRGTACSALSPLSVMFHSGVSLSRRCLWGQCAKAPLQMTPTAVQHYFAFHYVIV